MDFEETLGLPERPVQPPSMSYEEALYLYTATSRGDYIQFTEETSRRICEALGFNTGPHLPECTNDDDL